MAISKKRQKVSNLKLECEEANMSWKIASDLQKTKIFQSQIRLQIGKLRSWKIAISEKKVGTQKIGVQIGEYESWKIAIYKKKKRTKFFFEFNGKQVTLRAKCF